MTELEPFAPEPTVDLRHYWYVLYRRRWAFSTTLALVLLSSAIFVFARTPLYRATTTLLIESESPQLPEFTQSVRTSRFEEFYFSQAEILRSYTVAETAFAALGLEEPAFDEAKDPVLVFQKMLEVRLLRNTQLIEVSFEHPDPDTAAAGANSVAEAYRRHNLEGRRELSRDAFTWLSEQIAILKAQVAQSETALLEYKHKEGLLSLEKRQTLLEERLSELNERHAQAVFDRIELETLLREVRQLRVEPAMLEALPKVVENHAIQELKAESIRLESELARLALDFRPTHPRIQSLRLQLETLQSLLATEVDKVARSVEVEHRLRRANEDAVRAHLDGLKRESSHLARAAVQYAALKREAESNREMYEALLQRLKKTDIGGTITVNNARIVDRARPPALPFRPKKLRSLALALVLGLFLATGLCFVLEAFDQGIHSEEEIERDLGLPILGAVPRARFKPLEAPPEVDHAYSNIRTTLSFYRQKHLLRSLLVTSSVPEEGKTTSVIQIASALAKGGENVLVLEADLWRPRLRSIFSLAEGPGLTEFVRGEADLGEIISRLDAPRLAVIPAGLIPPRPEEVLGSDRMREALERLGADFDFMIIDGPPLSASLEVASLGRTADGVVFIVRAGSTARSAVRKGVDRVRRLGCNLVGVVLTAVEPSADGLGGYSYYRYRRYGRAPSEAKTSPTAAL